MKRRVVKSSMCNGGSVHKSHPPKRFVTRCKRQSASCRVSKPPRRPKALWRWCQYWLPMSSEASYAPWQTLQAQGLPSLGYPDIPFHIHHNAYCQNVQIHFVHLSFANELLKNVWKWLSATLQRNDTNPPLEKENHHRIVPTKLGEIYVNWGGTMIKTTQSDISDQPLPLVSFLWIRGGDLLLENLGWQSKFNWKLKND